MSNEDSTQRKRVNIQFSIDLDDLPGETARLFEKANLHASEASELFSTFDYGTDPLTVLSLNKIGAIRLALTKADLVLDDLQNIVSGYLRMQATPPEQSEVPTPGPSAATESPTPPIFDSAPPMMPPNNPFGENGPNFGGSGFSLAELQEKVQKAVEVINNEKSTEGDKEGL